MHALKDADDRQYSYSIGWTIEDEYEYHFIEHEYEICPEMWVKMRALAPVLDGRRAFEKTGAIAPNG